MDELTSKLKDALGQDVFNDIATEESTLIVNKNEISCDCKTVILRPKHARLILADDRVLEIQDELKNYQPDDRVFKNVIRGVYWFVDDMYKFEQMGYSKEISAKNISHATNPAVLTGLRYLACAECNLCPLGWFDPKTKENYLHVWRNLQC